MALTQPRHQRALGRASCTLAAGRVKNLHQSGAAKCMLPNVFGARPEVVFLNTAGGITGGDDLRYDLTLADGAAIGTTQTAERVYRSSGGAGRVTQRIDVGAGATLTWLPQETILFDGAALDRRTDVVLGEGATVIVLDILVFGRVAMGERVETLHLRDSRRVVQGGRVVHLDPVRMDSGLDGVAGLRGSRAVATLTAIGPGMADRVETLRDTLTFPEVRAGASAMGERLILRAMAEDAWPLRRLLARAIPVLSGQPLPRVWQI